MPQMRRSTGQQTASRNWQPKLAVVRTGWTRRFASLSAAKTQKTLSLMWKTTGGASITIFAMESYGFYLSLTNFLASCGASLSFFNEHMPRIEVLGVEVRQFSGQSVRALVPRVIGQTERARQDKVALPSRKISLSHIVESCPEWCRSFFEDLFEEAEKRASA